MLDNLGLTATQRNSLTTLTNNKEKKLYTASNPPAELINKMSILLLTLSNERWYLLRELASHLALLDGHADKNKMTLSNLRLILSPTLHMSPAMLQILVEQRRELFDRERAHTLATPQSSPVPPSSPKMQSYRSERGSAYDDDAQYAQVPFSDLQTVSSLRAESASYHQRLSNQSANSGQPSPFLQQGRFSKSSVPTPVFARFAGGSPIESTTPQFSPPTSYIPSRDPNQTFFGRAPSSRSSTASSLNGAGSRRRGDSRSSQMSHGDSTVDGNRSRSASFRVSHSADSREDLASAVLFPSLNNPNNPIDRRTPELSRSSGEESTEESEEAVEIVSSLTQSRSRVPSLAPSISLPEPDSSGFEGLLTFEERKQLFEA